LTTVFPLPRLRPIHSSSLYLVFHPILFFSPSDSLPFFFPAPPFPPLLTMPRCLVPFFFSPFLFLFLIACGIPNRFSLVSGCVVFFRPFPQGIFSLSLFPHNTPELSFQLFSFFNLGSVPLSLFLRWDIRSLKDTLCLFFPPQNLLSGANPTTRPSLLSSSEVAIMKSFLTVMPLGILIPP